VIISSKPITSALASGMGGKTVHQEGRSTGSKDFKRIILLSKVNDKRFNDREQINVLHPPL
jgi:hypothetical protein